MTADRLEALRPEIAAALAEGVERLSAAGPGPSDGSFAPEHPRALVAAGLHRLVVPAARGGFGAGMREMTLVQAALGAVDGSAALGLAMQHHVVGGALQSAARSWPLPLLEELLDGIVRDGSLVDTAAAEEMAGSPQRGNRGDTTAAADPDGTFRISGEKAWVTWLPALRWVLLSAALDEGIGIFLLPLSLPGVEIDGRFASLGLRSSGSGHLRLHEVCLPASRLVLRRGAQASDPRGPAPLAWFGMAVAATYLGIGEGARAWVARYARDRRPGDAPAGVATIPTVAVRLGRLDAALRAARIVVLETARRWDATPAADSVARQALLDEVALAKVTATNAAIAATDDALRIAGGPGLADGPLERAFRDARAGLVHPPLDDLAYQGFSRRLVDGLGAARSPDEPGSTGRAAMISSQLEP